MPEPIRFNVKKTQSTETPTATLTTRDRLETWRQNFMAKHWRLAISGLFTAVAAGAVGLNLGIVELWDRQVQSLYFELRGPVAAPKDIVILAIDEESLSQGQYFFEDPKRYKDLEFIKDWPWQRQAYATVIDRVMGAGAKAIAIDVIFPSPSSYGQADDDALARTLKRHGDNVVLAAQYELTTMNQGSLAQAYLPLPAFQATGARMGVINYPKELNQQIQRLGEEFLRSEQSTVVTGTAPVSTAEPLLQSFAQETLEAANIPYDKVPRENIFFYGPNGTFERIPLWYVLDSDPWQNKLQAGRFFKDKIVIVGTTALRHQDFHKAPFSESLLYPQSMAGVEILANSVATLANDISPTRLIKSPAINGLIVLALGLGAAGLMSRTVKPLERAAVAVGGMGLWGLVTYGAFVGGKTVLIAGAPMLMLGTLGVIDFGVGFAADRLKRKRLRTTLARYATSPLVQEIISQQDDFQDLLDVHRANIVGLLLRDRYRIMKVLGAGGFGETYLAQDTLRPGNPVCVVKQLKIVSDNPKAHRLARRLFESEAEVLGRLGEHGQIPRLLAYFEEQESFYLVQEMVEGKLLRDLLSRSRPISQRAVVGLLKDLLPVISFVHSQGVIHRDIKPSNIIQRSSDNRYVLIDFGAVKTISNKLPGAPTQITATVGIGTQGYMPSEQSAGMPTVRSDIYALGITAIEALTGRPPHALKRSENGEIIWSHTIADISPVLSRIINKMVRYDFNNRYHSVQSVLDDLEGLDESQLKDSPATASQDFAEISEATYNQGTRPGVIDTNSELDETRILPTDWPNELTTQADPEKSLLENYED
jgi:serine/threonine protein kinase/CHASE2 domain-containing sensor protein